MIVRSGPVSLKADRRVLAATAALSLVSFAAVVAGIAVGEFPVPPLEVLASLAGAGSPAVDFIVLDLRLPRVLTALLAGAALGMSGAVFQQVARNPLVAPDVVGVAGGASLAAVAVIVFGAGVPLSVAALAGALVAGALLYALAWRRGVSGHRFVLVGIGMAALAQAGVGYVLTEGRIFEVSEAYVWLVGSVNGRGWEHVWPLAAALLLLSPALVALARRADMLELGDDLARGLGVHAERSRLALLAAAVVLTGIAVAATGPVGFVAFVAPHLARRIGRPASLQGLLPLAAACGAALVVVSDLAGRVLFAPTEIPVGLITSILAAPYFLLLLRRAA